jgi:peptidyl-prolyl cis-trans isomerase A (cyclophilin A)
MRRIFAIATLFSLASVAAWGQSDAAPKATPDKAAAKPSTPAAKPKKSGEPTAVIETTVGKMTCTLFPDKAPLGVANFIGLATGTKDWRNPVSGATKHGVPLYDGTIFHRVIPEFMIQGGDPAGTGSGADPVAKFKNEVSSDLRFDRPGRLAYANAGRDTNGSQFFITEVATPSLNGGYTIFGQCDEATVTLVKQIARMATDPSTDHHPFRPVKIVHITIDRGVAAAKPPTPAKPAADAQKPASN